MVSAVYYNIEVTITSEEQITFLENYFQNEDIRVLAHIKIDTGMNRVGFAYQSIEEIFSKLKNCSKIELKGIYSHFSTSDESNGSYAKLQLKRFNEIRDYINNRTDEKILFHMANSGAIMKIPEAYYDMVRPGIMLYGYPPSPDFPLTWELREVMAVKSKIALIKFLNINEPVSYGRRYYTKDKTNIGVIPIGYADGLNRANSNNAYVIIRGKKYPLVGTVCMDMIMIDLGRTLHCQIGDEVIIYGENTTITEVARRLNTIPYEITCNVSARVPRVHIYN
jgi:alanine racemase